MDKRDPYEGNFVEALDLEKPVTVTISEVVPPYALKSADGRVIDRAVLRFEKAHKGLVLNRTNYRVLRALFGSKTGDWVGQRITIARRYVDAFGERDVMAVRVIPPKGTPLPLGVIHRMGKTEPGG